MRKVQFVFAIAVMVIFLGACGKASDTSSADLEPVVIADSLLKKSEETFFEDYHVNKDMAELTQTESVNRYLLAEQIMILDCETYDIIAEFKDGMCNGIRYRVAFEGDYYLEQAYQFLCEYEAVLNEEYGMPVVDQGEPFTIRYPNFEYFRDNPSSGLASGKLTYFGLVDTYVCGNDTQLEIELAADEEVALVTMKLFSMNVSR